MNCKCILIFIGIDVSCFIYFFQKKKRVIFNFIGVVSELEIRGSAFPDSIKQILWFMLFLFLIIIIIIIVLKLLTIYSDSHLFSNVA